MDDIRTNLRAAMDQQGLTAHYRKLVEMVQQDHDVQDFLTAHQQDLDAAVLQKSASKLYEFVTEKAKLKKGQPTFAPGYEPELVLNDHQIEVAYRPTANQLEKQQRQASLQRFQTIGMTTAVKQARLSDYEPTDQRMVAIKAVYDFLEKEHQVGHGFLPGLYLSGPFGVGKTYLMAAMAQQLAATGTTVCLVHFPSFAVTMKGAIGNNQVTEKLNRVKQVPVLIIDDIGADAMSAWIRDEVLGVILEYRMQHELSTFFTSNFTIQQLGDEHLATTSRGDVEPLKAKRLLERIHFLARPIEIDGKNRRQES
ncbi:primosomal protein DnaI [Fructilactobacillus florum]|uniref:Primosomal protein DnaI n=1 Tax=Fructilactobacillus florum DSM 22689 = JCM 16035 TaxID=1423745 RepID=A0A0R2CJL7_9LACO|nr:primosomal protein DnaI [Fructilactobacillus florum]KRM91839.1 primosomal protein DnaI [Fructilactobacillus florum DSM 22689 = JCM 16035]